MTGRSLVYLHHRSQLRTLRLPVPCASITYRDVELLVQVRDMGVYIDCMMKFSEMTMIPLFLVLTHGQIAIAVP